MTRNHLLCLLFSFVSLYAAGQAPFTLSENDLVCYNTLKEAVFERFEADIPGFCKIFGEAFQEPTEESIVILGCLVTDIGPWQETYPPRSCAKIGTKEVHLHGTVGLIIYSARNNFPQLIELFDIFKKAVADGYIKSEEDLIEFVTTFCVAAAFYELKMI